ncbi:MAG: hypothetical protein M3Q16_00995 [Pseudomonadota bacterium]|nr:hypothetical protein [Pseudomonadota bacterium]
MQIHKIEKQIKKALSGIRIRLQECIALAKDQFMAFDSSSSCLASHIVMCVTAQTARFELLK